MIRISIEDKNEYSLSFSPSTPIIVLNPKIEPINLKL